MKITVSYKPDDYIHFIKELTYSNRFNRLFMYIGLILGLYAGYRYLQTQEFLTGFLIFGLLFVFLPKIQFFLEKRKLLSASYFNDLLDEQSISFMRDEIIFEKSTEEYRCNRSEIHEFFELPSFYVIALQELHQFPLPKKQISEDEEIFLRDFFRS
jgi:hypothetical protein